MYAAKLNENAAGGALAVISDVTRLRKLEIMRSEFVANVTHELKTPLTSIRGYIELLKSGERDAETAQSFYEIIEIEAERLQKLTDDLLQLSDIENGAAEPELTPVLIAETVRKVADTLRPEAESRRIALHTFVEEGLSVRANPRRLYQLIKNLMENAVKYNRDGGRSTCPPRRNGEWRSFGCTTPASASRPSTSTASSSGFTGWIRAARGSWAARASACPLSSIS